ncbi:MAG TPA: hypothetical protein VM166_05995 [Gemmatimonadaceae bacterium]|nr:hypothetical protein [Gemmatimonadaceae bacterium]
MRAVDALLNGLVDYAGLFPPASQDMRSAVQAYASYLLTSDRPALGRFIVPLARLAEFETATLDLLPRGPEGEPWRLSVLVGDDFAGASDRILNFNRQRGPESAEGHAIIDAIELKANTADEISRKHAQLPRSATVYYEIPITANCAPLIDAIGAAKARAKMRTGGITSDAFPSTEAVLGFMTACARKRVAFKATAGLHHPVRGTYNLTYDAGSARGTMYGYLNVFVAAALLFRGENISLAKEVLEESDPAAFKMSGQALEWRATRLTADDLRSVRSEFAISFGSCSFREPVDELHELMTEVHA